MNWRSSLWVSLGSATWWYGVGGEIPANTVSFYETVLHEIGHGLGFSTLVDLANGTEALGMPDVYESNLRDIGLGQFWPDMTDTERRDSAIGEDLHWGGSCVTTLCGRVDSGRSPAGELEMYAPTSLAPGSSVAHWDLSLTPDELMEPVSTAARSRDLLTRELMKDLGWKLSELAIEPVGQVNANLTEDIAVLAPDFIGGTNVVRVLDGNSGATIQSLFFVAALSTLDMETIDSFAGTAANEVAVLLNDPVTRQSRIMIKDASSGALLNTLTYATTLTPIDFEVLPDFAGGPAPEIALLLRESTGAQRVRVMIKDAGTGATVRDQFFVKSFMPMDLEILPDFGGTSSPELAVLARNCADDRVQVLVKDADNGVLLNSVPYAKNFIPLDLEVVPDFGGTSAAELAVLARSSVDGSIVVRVKDSQSDATLSAVNFSKFFTPHQFEMVPHFGGSAAGEIALVLRQNSNGSMRVLVKDASTGATLQNMTFAANRFPRGLAVIPDISGNGVSEIGMLSVRETDNQKTAIIRDPSTNGLVRFQIVP